MWAIFIGRLRPKLAYEFFQVVCTTCLIQFFEVLIFSIFSLVNIGTNTGYEAEPQPPRGGEGGRSPPHLKIRKCYIFSIKELSFKLRTYFE